MYSGAKKKTSMVTNRLVSIYVCIMFGLCIWTILYFALWCPPPVKPEIKAFPHAPANVKKQLEIQDKSLKEKEKQLAAKEQWLRQLESQLLLKFPSEKHLIRPDDNIPTIYAITPTYARPVQKAELTRLAQTFLHVKNFHWIIIEDGIQKTQLVTNLLKNCGLHFTHLHIQTPKEVKMTNEDPNWLKPRGVLQRNLALQWIRDNLSADIHKGVIYFADDDNTYDLRVFDEMRHTKVASVWPVGLVGNLWYEKPICADDKVTGFYTYWKPERPFPMDMAGFAVSLERFFNRPEAMFKIRVKRGYQESEFLSKLVTVDELEPKADMCTKVLVWHTRTEKADLRNEEKFRAKGKPGSDPRIEV